jgi:hypothetical protein
VCLHVRVRVLVLVLRLAEAKRETEEEVRRNEEEMERLTKEVSAVCTRAPQHPNNLVPGCPCRAKALGSLSQPPSPLQSRLLGCGRIPQHPSIWLGTSMLSYNNPCL